MKEATVALGKHLFGAPPPLPKLTLGYDEAQVLFDKEDLNVYFSNVLRLGDYAKADLLKVRVWSEGVIRWNQEMRRHAFVLGGFLGLVTMLLLTGFVPFPDRTLLICFCGVQCSLLGTLVGYVLVPLRRALRYHTQHRDLATCLYRVLAVEHELAKQITHQHPNGIPAAVIQDLWKNTPTLAWWRKINIPGLESGPGSQES